MNRIFVIIIAMLALAPLAAASSHLDGGLKPPHQFYGDVTINGNPAPIGTDIRAEVRGNDGDVHGSTAVQTAGQYGRDNDIFYVEEPDGENFEGEQISFYVNDVLATTYAPYRSGHSTELDLSATIEGFGEEDETASTGGGGGGGGGGGFSTASADNESDDGDSVNISGVNPADQPNATSDSGEVLNLTGSCTPDWRCSEWTECVNGFQNRRCVDINQCGTNESLPDERRTCDAAEEPQEAGFFSALTGAVTGGGAATWGALIAALAIFAILGGLYVYAKRKD